MAIFMAAPRCTFLSLWQPGHVAHSAVVRQVQDASSMAAIWRCNKNHEKSSKSQCSTCFVFTHATSENVTLSVDRRQPISLEILIHSFLFICKHSFTTEAAEGFQRARKLTKRVRIDQGGESIFEL